MYMWIVKRVAIHCMYMYMYCILSVLYVVCHKTHTCINQTIGKVKPLHAYECVYTEHCTAVGTVRVYTHSWSFSWREGGGGIWQPFEKYCPLWMDMYIHDDVHWGDQEHGYHTSCNGWP